MSVALKGEQANVLFKGIRDSLQLVCAHREKKVAWREEFDLGKS